MFFRSPLFATSSPNVEDKFKWTIDDISNLKPANIDEATVSQHVFVCDPQIESLVQQKIEYFFQEPQIVPSPLTEIVRVPLLSNVEMREEPDQMDLKSYSDSE